MRLSDIATTRIIFDGGETLPPHDNDNLELMTGCNLTPAELMQWIRREKARLSRQIAADPALWRCTDHRRDWLVTLGLEKLVRWQCYGEWGA